MEVKVALDVLMQMAASGGAALVGAAGTDAWRFARDGFVRLFGRGDAHLEELAARRLDSTRTAVEGVAEPDRAEVRRQSQAEWQTRLNDLFEEDAAAVDEAADLIRQIRDRLPVAEQRWVQNIVVSGSGAQANVVQGGNIVNHYGPGRD